MNEEQKPHILYPNIPIHQDSFRKDNMHFCLRYLLIYRLQQAIVQYEKEMFKIDEHIKIKSNGETQKNNKQERKAETWNEMLIYVKRTIYRKK